MFLTVIFPNDTHFVSPLLLHSSPILLGLGFTPEIGPNACEISILFFKFLKKKLLQAYTAIMELKDVCYQFKK